MTALAADRNTIQKEQGRTISLGVEAGETIYKGALVSVDGDGYAIPAADTASTIVIGVADHLADNSGGADGDINVRVRKGVHAFLNDGNVAQADVGSTVTVLDDQTVSVAGTTTNDIVAGTLDALDGGSAGDLCYVKIHEHG